MFFTPAFAQAAGGDSGSQVQALLQEFLPIGLVVVVFYFLLIRPQQQRAKELKARQASLRRGDRVVTAGGIVGTVARIVNDEEAEVTIAEGVRVLVVRSTIGTILAKTEPAKGDGGPPDSKGADGKSGDGGAAKKRAG